MLQYKPSSLSKYQTIVTRLHEQKGRPTTFHSKFLRNWSVFSPQTSKRNPVACPHRLTNVPWHPDDRLFVQFVGRAFFAAQHKSAHPRLPSRVQAYRRRACRAEIIDRSRQGVDECVQVVVLSCTVRKRLEGIQLCRVSASELTRFSLGERSTGGSVRRSWQGRDRTSIQKGRRFFCRNQTLDTNQPWLCLHYASRGPICYQ